MSIGAYSSMKHVQSVSAAVDYFEHGVGREARQRRREGLTRVVAERSDYATSAEFVRHAEQLRRNTARKTVGFQTVISMPADVLNSKDAADQQLMADLAYEIMKRNFPSSPVIVKVHGDTDNVHAHCISLNVDLYTGKAVTKNRMHWHLRQNVDAVMREHNFPVMEISKEPVSQQAYWTAERGVQVDNWEKRLHDGVRAAVEHSDDRATLEESLGQYGVDMRVRMSKEGKETGISFGLIGEDGHRKAGGRLSPKLTLAKVDEQLAANKAASKAKQQPKSRFEELLARYQFPTPESIRSEQAVKKEISLPVEPASPRGDEDIRTAEAIHQASLHTEKVEESRDTTQAPEAHQERVATQGQPQAPHEPEKPAETRTGRPTAATEQPKRRQLLQVRGFKDSTDKAVDLIAQVDQENSDGSAWVTFQVAHTAPQARGQRGLHLRAQSKVVGDKTLVSTATRISASQYASMKQAAGDQATTVRSRPVYSFSADLAPHGLAYVPILQRAQPSKSRPQLDERLPGRQLATENAARQAFDEGKTRALTSEERQWYIQLRDAQEGKSSEYPQAFIESKSKGYDDLGL